LAWLNTGNVYQIVDDLPQVDESLEKIITIGCYALNMKLLLTVLGLLTIVPAIAQKPVKPTSPPEVVFVCEHGAAKSIIAAAYFNKLAAERGLPQRAIARGVNLDPLYSPAVVQGLKNDGITIQNGRPELVSDKDLAAGHIVTLGCKLPRAPSDKSDLRNWDEVDMGEGYAAARDAIVKRVQQLIQELTARRQQ
jgi:arsenate reductase